MSLSTRFLRGCGFALAIERVWGIISARLLNELKDYA